MMHNLLGHIFNLFWLPVSNPKTVLRHPGGRQGGYALIAMAAVGAYEGYQSNQNANAAAGGTGAAAAEQGQLASRNERVSNQMLSRYSQLGIPELQEYIKASETPADPNAMAGAAGAAVDQEAAGAQKNMDATNMSYGLDPNSGRAMSEKANFNLNEAVAKAGAMTNARNNAINTTLQRLGAGVQAGGSLLSAGESFGGEAVSGFGSTGSMDNEAANYYGNEAEGFGQLAGYGFGRAAPLYTYNGALSTPSVNPGAVSPSTTPIYQISPGDQPTPSLYG